MTYYIDVHAGAPASDGLTPETARRDYRDLTLLPGDKVLFKRGSFIRDSLYRKPGTPENYITYGAYGEGEAPVFCGSQDVHDPALWEEIAPHIWKCTAKQYQCSSLCQGISGTGVLSSGRGTHCSVADLC